MEDMANKAVDVADKMNEGAEKLKTIGKEDGCNGGHDGWGLRQICANFGGRRDKGCANFCASGRCANGLRINCLEWQKTRRWPRFLSKNAAKMKKTGTERIDFTNNRITLHIINIGATYNQYRRAYKRNKQNFKFLALYQQTASTNKETENN